MREMQIKTMMWNHLIYVKMVTIKKNQKMKDVGMDVVKREHFYTTGGNINKYNHYGKQCGDSLKN